MDDQTEEIEDRGGIGTEGGDNENADTLPAAPGKPTRRRWGTPTSTRRSRRRRAPGADEPMVCG
jgi:hypothetical protein